MFKSHKNIVNIFIHILILFIILFATSCGRSDDNALMIMGSTALQPLAEKAAAMFMTDFPESNIQVQGGGSGNGLTAVRAKNAQIGNSDIFAEDKNGFDSSDLIDHKVAVVGFAVIANQGVGIDNVSSKQLTDLFTGKITNWKEIGGNNVPVVIVSRPASSGTRLTFEKYALNGATEIAGKALTQDSSGTVVKTVMDTEGAVSYVGLTYVKGDGSLKVLKVDGVEPSPENIASGKYQIWAYEHMYTNGYAKGITKEYIDYIMSDKVKPYIEKLDYIPISDMKVER
ncbi:MAG: phosphate ABC transporter substrate-binding protein [Clostridiales bacterium]|nr:phosphate ABC transporter substrate-binding protein [Clostridiales bacterium]HBM81340.1 phosphate-binding protein [Clostridiaceae bacterium]